MVNKSRVRSQKAITQISETGWISEVRGILHKKVPEWNPGLMDKLAYGLNKSQTSQFTDQ